jgi:hypothetical protein
MTMKKEKHVCEKRMVLRESIHLEIAIRIPTGSACPK